MTDSLRETLDSRSLGTRPPDTARITRDAHDMSVSALFLMLAIGSGLLYWLAIAVLSGSSMAFDDAILRHLHRYDQTPLEHFANLICMLVTVFSVAVFATLCWRRRWQLASFWFCSTAGASILCGIAKKAVQRHRPELWALGSPHASFSFPSGHATQSMAFVIALLLLATPGKRKAVLLLGLAWIVVVGMCRLYLGLHYPTDIVAGWALATAWTCLLGLLFRLPRTAAPHASSPY